MDTGARNVQDPPAVPGAVPQQMIELVGAGKTPAELSREFGCSAQTISNWVARRQWTAVNPCPVRMASPVLSARS